MDNQLYDGFSDLFNELEEAIKKTENTQDVLLVGAKELVKDLLKLTKPYSKIKKAGYTHLVDTFAYRKYGNKEVEVGWGKYYGRMVEDGTSKTYSQPHLKPTFERNKNKYYSLMLKKLNL